MPAILRRIIGSARAAAGAISRFALRAAIFGFGLVGASAGAVGRTAAGSLAAIERVALRQPDRVLAGIALVAVAAVIIVVRGEDKLVLGGPRSEPPTLDIRIRGFEPVRSGPYRVALTTMRSQILTDPLVESVRRGSVSPDRRSTVLRVSFGGSIEGAEGSIERIERELDPGILEISFAGQAAVLRETREQVLSDLQQLLIAVPLAILLLAALLGARLGLAAAFATAAAAFGAGAVCVGLATLTGLSALALAGAGAGGLLAGLHLSALVARGAPGPTLAAVSVAGAVPFGALALLDLPYLSALALGGAISWLLALPLSIAAMNAAIALWGHRRGAETPVARVFRRLASMIGWSRLTAAGVALFALVVLVVVAVPATRLEPIALAAPEAPPVSTERAVLAASLALVAVGLIAAAVHRSFRLPALVSICSAAIAAATAGLLVLIFQDGRLGDLLDFRSPAAVHFGSALAAAAIVASGSAAHAVGLLATVRRTSAGGAGRTDPGLEALSLSAVPAVLACLTAAAAAAALTGSEEIAIKEFGLAVAAGLLLDLVVVRLLLHAALLRLLHGRRGSSPNRVAAGMSTPDELSSPFDELIGTEWIVETPDEARCSLDVRDEHRQPLGVVHGGIYSTLIEGICSRTTYRCVRGEGMIATGQAINVSFLRPITAGTINVLARARQQGSTTWIWDAEVTDDEGRLCALGRMTVAVRPRR